MNAKEPEQKEGKILIPYIEDFLERYELRKIHVDFMHRVVLLVIAGLGLITALSWDELFKDIFKELFGSLSSVEQKLIYALFLTIATAGITVLLTKLVKNRSKKDKV